MPQSTLKRYLSLFETVFMTNMLPAWSTNLTSRLIKSPKVHLNDSGLAAHLMGMNRARLSVPSPIYGQLLETFVVGEFAKLAAWAQHRVKLFHYRTLANREVDLVLESADGRVIGIEIKASTQVDARDFAGLRSLAEDAGARFAYGIVLHNGDTIASFGRGFQAAPISILWRTQQAEP
jgi:predicted AAA+ superfamily ATPase